ncbi:hypothetical protein [Paramicrobacterium fandaimingii]|uniref:hypothetical protein n=1 Tax=Paramicrobacterium fandaimingii TaxID=2708079 RepID=UPI00141F9C82|nr:hypothetical protein [Microbacterium fandaimingii]
MMSQTMLYGLGIETDFDLHDAGASDLEKTDVRVRTGPDLQTNVPQPSGERLLDFETNEPWYTLVRTAQGDLHFRVHGVCDYLISSDFRDVELRMNAGVERGMDGVMTVGALVSLLLYLKGTSVFHGSAVDVGGRGIAFVGHSGQGKTTMATLFCAEGASVITDDVLVVDSAQMRPRIRRGTRELRLRSGIEELADRAAGGAFRVSADARRVIAPRHSDAADVPLHAIVVPNPTRDGSPMRFERLGEKDALLALLGFPRLMGWRDQSVLSRVFKDASVLAARVPVLLGHIPWGPPFPEGITTALLTTVDA